MRIPIEIPNVSTFDILKTPFGDVRIFWEGRDIIVEANRHDRILTVGRRKIRVYIYFDTKERWYGKEEPYLYTMGDHSVFDYNRGRISTKAREAILDVLTPIVNAWVEYTRSRKVDPILQFVDTSAFKKEMQDTKEHAHKLHAECLKETAKLIKMIADGP
jgi:hypothetical protein